MLESAIMSCLPRSFPTQRVFIKKTLRLGLYLVANSHNISKFGSILKATDRVLLRNVLFAILITIYCHLLVQSNLDYPDSFGHRKFLDVRIAEKVRITKIKMAAVHKHPNDGGRGLDR